jgi:hypothetical protein
VFAKVLLLPVIRKTAYYADFAGNCQWGRQAGLGLHPVHFHRKDAKDAKFFVSEKNPSFRPGLVCRMQGSRGFSYKRLIFFASSAPLRLSWLAVGR